MEWKGKLKSVSRARFAQIWRDYRAGKELDEEDQLLAKCMADHPEWTRWWEIADDIGDTPVLEAWVDPFLAVAVEAAVEGMIGPGGDTAAQTAYNSLRRRGLAHVDARAEIGRALLGMIWQVETGKVHPGDADRRFRSVLERIAAGESTRDIFPD
jgi:hypothetical protein